MTVVTAAMARRMFELVEPIGVIPYAAEEPHAAIQALGVGGPWDAYFAGRAAPLGRDVPAEVVDAIFYSFAEGEVARHIPRVWERVEPEDAHAARLEGCVAALVASGIGRTECHVLHALSEGMPAGEFGRVGHLPAEQLDAVVDGMRARGLVGPDGWLTAAGREVKARVEALTDELAGPAYAVLAPADLDQLVSDLEPIAATLVAAGREEPP